MAKVQGGLVYTGKHNDRLNVTRTVAAMAVRLTGRQGNIHTDMVADELACLDAGITRAQVAAALSHIANTSSKYLPRGLHSTGEGWYCWRSGR